MHTEPTRTRIWLFAARHVPDELSADLSWAERGEHRCLPGWP